jgi:hypothetical protein
MFHAIATTTFPIALRGLLQLPPETRIRIYELAFLDSKCAISYDSDRQRKPKEHLSRLVKFKSSGFPIRPTEVFRLLYEEVVDYMAFHLNAKSNLDTGNLQVAIQDLIPGHCRARVWHLHTSNTVTEQNMLLNVDFLPKLRSRNVHLGTTLVKSAIDSFDDTCECDEPSREIAQYQNVNRYVAQCFFDF